MGIMVYSLLWVMQDLYHQPYVGERLYEGCIIAWVFCHRVLAGVQTPKRSVIMSSTRGL